MTADALERLRELASTAALQQHRYYTDGVETLEHADHTNPFDTCQSADCALVRAGGVERTPARARTHGADGKCSRCGETYPNHISTCIHSEYECETAEINVLLDKLAAAHEALTEAGVPDPNCALSVADRIRLLAARGAVEPPAQEPSEVVCECGHLASEHGSPKPTRCIVRGCGCKKNRAMVEATDVPQQSEDADIVRDITAIVREADETFQRVGGGTRHWVRDCFLPFLNQKGWIVTGAAIVRSARPSPPPAEAQERYEAAVAQVLIELAFLLPRGTDIRVHPIGVKLLEMVKAQRAFMASPPPATPQEQTMSHRDTCPSRWDAEREGERAQEYGYGRWRNPYDDHFHPDRECDEAAEAWRSGYRRAEMREEEQREEDAARHRAEMRRAELQAEEDYYAQRAAEDYAQAQEYYAEMEAKELAEMEAAALHGADTLGQET